MTAPSLAAYSLCRRVSIESEANRAAADSVVAVASLHIARVIVKSLPPKVSDRLSACKYIISECHDAFEDPSVVSTTASLLGSIGPSSNWAPKVGFRGPDSTDAQEYMKVINTVADDNRAGCYRPRGFAMTEAFVGDTTLLPSTKARQRLEQGDVIIYVDREGLVLKVSETTTDILIAKCRGLTKAAWKKTF